MSDCHLQQLPDSVLCHVWAFLIAAAPPAAASSDGSFQPLPPSSQHYMLLTSFNRVSKHWHALARDTEAWGCEEATLLVSFFPQHPACSFLALLQPSFHWLRAHLQHLVLTVAVSDGASASSGRTTAFVNLLRAAAWPHLRSLTLLGSDSADFHSQVDLHALWHTCSETIVLPSKNVDAGATESVPLFPLLQHVTLRHGMAAPFLLNLRTGAAPCCSRSPFQLLSACPQLTSLTLHEVYIEQRVARELMAMPHLQRLRLYDLAIDTEPWQQWLATGLRSGGGLPALRALSLGLRLPMRASQLPCRRLELPQPLAALGLPTLTELELQGRWECNNTMQAVQAHAKALQLQRLTLRWVWERSTPAIGFLRPSTAGASIDEDRMWSEFDAHLFAQQLPCLRHLSLLELRSPNPLASARKLLTLFRPVLPQLHTLQLSAAPAPTASNSGTYEAQLKDHFLGITEERRPALRFV